MAERLINAGRILQSASSQKQVWELSTMAHLRGLESNQTKAKIALKVLYIEQLGLPVR